MRLARQAVPWHVQRSMASIQPWKIESSSFSEILPFWKDQLWPERNSPIEPTSAINSKGEIEVGLLRQPSFFYKATVDSKIVGVVSCQITGTSLRSRGLWVDPEWRRRGVAKGLLQAVFAKARELEIKTVWTMPRQKSLEFYKKVGFVATSELNDFEFGPHYLATLENF